MSHICTPGHGPRLSEVNLHTLLSLWMEIFPQKQPEDTVHNQVIDVMSLWCLGCQQSLQCFDQIQIFLIASAVTGPWGGSGGGTRR